MRPQILALLLGGVFALPAFADGEIGADFRSHAAPGAGKSSEQVRAEVIAAKRAGTLLANGETDKSAREMFPAWYPSYSVQLAGKTREQVRAEHVSAYRTGNVILDGETGETAREMHPAWYADTARAEIRAKLGDTAE